MVENKLITELRGLAALLVMLFHFVCVSNNFLGIDFAIDIFSYGKFGVQIFFLISAYVLTISLIRSNYKIQNLPLFIVKRIIRIEPPYLLSICFILLISYLKFVFSYPNRIEPPTIRQILFHIGYLIPFSNYSWMSIVYWTLAIEFQFYIILSFLFPVFKKNEIHRFLILNSLSLSILISSYFFNIENPTVGIITWLPIFVSGIVIAFSFENKKLNSTTIFTILLADVIIFYFHEMAVVIFVVIFQFILSRNMEFKSNLLYFLGKISYSIYLLHTIIGFLLINLGFKLLTDNLAARALYLIATICTTVLFSFYFNKFFELPFQKIASKFKYK